MKDKLLCLLLCLMLILSIGSYAYATTETDVEHKRQAQGAADSLAATDGPYYLVNGVAVSDPSMKLYHGTTYVSLQSAILAVYPNASITWPSEKALVTADGLTMTVGIEDRYVSANGRYLYIDQGVKSVDGRILLPIRTLAKAMGGYVMWNTESNVATLYTDMPIAAGDTFYTAEDVYWLSRIINAESGGEPLNGKLAVGTVVLNRVEDPQFPETIYDVIFDRRTGVWQFTPAGSGSVYREPNEESVIAAKLCLEGIRVGEESLYFVNRTASPNSWASRNRPYVATIGRHTFFA